MANHIVLLCFAFNLILLYADGRSLQKKYMREKVDHLTRNFLFSNNIKVGAVSRATNISYNAKINYNDVSWLNALCTNYPWLSEEKLEDPCKWTWIICNMDDIPRITALYLSGKTLSGSLPDFSSMSALQSIDLSYNILTGPIPSFLATFPHLEELYLEYNYFTGQVPDSLACDKNLKLRINNNRDIYTSSACPLPYIDPYPPSNTTSNTYYSDGSSSNYEETATSTKKLAIILGATLLAFFVFRAFVGIFAYFHHNSKVAAAVAEASTTAV